MIIAIMTSQALYDPDLLNKWMKESEERLKKQNQENEATIVRLAELIKLPTPKKIA